MKRILFFQGAAAACFTLFLISGATALAGTWSIGVLDSDGNVGKYCQLQIDGDGNLHAVYLRDDLDMIKIVSRISDIWLGPDTIVSEEAGGYPDLAISPIGEKKVSYYRNGIGALAYAGPEPVDEWSGGQISSSPDDIGLALSTVPRGAGEISLTCRNTTAGALLLYTRSELGAWSAPQTLDPGPSRGRYNDHAYSPMGGLAFCEYASDGGMLLYADTVLHTSAWDVGPVTASADDIGKSMSIARRPTGDLSLMCRNATEGSLLLLTRDEAGAWSSPLIVDPGPGRGQHSDHAYRPGAGYAFSEYASSGTMLLFADPILHADAWTLGTIYGTPYSGKFPCAVRAPDGRIASAFYHFDEMGGGLPYISALYPSGYAAIRAVDDTIGNDASEGVYIDMALTPEWDWHLSYRNGLDGHLWYAFSDAYIITAVDEENDPGSLPSVLRLHQSYPNPFNPTAVIAYEVPVSGMVSLRIYDAAGRLVRTLANELKSAGAYKATWNGRNNRGARVASGVYFVRLSQGDAARTMKVVLMR